MALATAIVTTAVAVGSGIFSAVKAKKAQKLDNQIRLQQLRRQRVKQLREARIKRAQIANIAAQTGAAGASGALTATAGTAQEAGRNIAFLDVIGNLSRQRSRALGGVALGQSIGQFATTIGGFASANSARIFGE